jgi:hypothetical protein
MVVMWITRDLTVNPLCKYSLIRSLNSSDEDEQSLEFSTVASAKDMSIGTWKVTIYTAVLTNLRSYTMYSYRVGSWSLGVFSKEYTFTTPHYGSFPFTMVTFADFKILDEMNKSQQILKRLENNLSQFDIILQYGDICYAEGNQEVWDKFFQQIQPVAGCKPWMVTVGNHENEGENGYTAYENRFKMPGNNNFWYSFNFGFAHFLVISTEHDLSPDSPQHKFIISDLEKANKLRMEVPWLIITGHRAFYGSNKRCVSNPLSHSLRDKLVPIIDKYGVDLALFGNCHAYERTHPLYNGEIDPRGTIYLLAGVAGTPLDKDWEVQPQWSAYRTAHHGYGLLHVKSRKKLSYCYQRVGDGKMWDCFTLTKRKVDKKKISYDYENKFLKNWVINDYEEDKNPELYLNGSMSDRYLNDDMAKT